MKYHRNQKSLSKADVIELRWASATVGGEMPIYEHELRVRRLEKLGLLEVWRNENGLKVCKLTGDGRAFLNSLDTVRKDTPEN